MLLVSSLNSEIYAEISANSLFQYTYRYFIEIFIQTIIQCLRERKEFVKTRFLLVRRRLLIERYDVIDEFLLSPIGHIFEHDNSTHPNLAQKGYKRTSILYFHKKTCSLKHDV